jgi:putative PIG3 family NAD(P)H quinone oxidoreductase
MKAVVLEAYGEPDVLNIQEIPSPQLSAGEVLVKIIAAGINRADIMQRQGRYSPPEKQTEEILGLEFAGVIEELSSSSRDWQVGDRVFGLLPGGGYAEKVVTPERMLMTIPDNLSFLEAAAIPEVFFTAYDALLMQGNFQAGDRVLIHAAGSGVGTAALQLAQVMGASQIFTTSRSDSKQQRLQEIIPHRTINATTENFAEVVNEATDGKGADIILDFVGADYLEKNLQAVAVGGTVVQIATLSGTRTEMDLRQVMGKRMKLVGTTLRNRPLEAKMTLTQTFAKQVLPWFKDRRIKPIIDCSFPLEEVAAAHQYMESNQNFGKILLQVKEEA